MKTKQLIITSLIAVSLASCGGSKDDDSNSAENEQYKKDSIAMAKMGEFFSCGDDNGKIGFKDQKGTFVIKPQFYSADPEFSPYHMAVVQNKEYKYGVINKLGTFVLPMEYDFITSQRGSVFICSKNDLYGIIDVKGDTIIPFTYKKLEFSANGTFTCENKEGKYGVIDIKNEVVIPFKFDFISARVVQNRRMFKDKNMKYGYMDSLYKVVIKPEYMNAKDFSDNGLTSVQNSSKKWGVINSKNAKISTFDYNDIWGYGYKGFAAVTNDFEHYGYLNAKGELVVPIKYIVVSEFGNDNTATVKLNKADVATFKIDTLGNIVK